MQDENRQSRKRKRPGVEVHRLQIIEATKVILQDHAVEAVSVKMIIEYASISRDTFYRCFKSVDTVIEAIYDQWKTDMAMTLVQSAERLRCAEEFIQELIPSVVALAVKTGPVVRTLHIEELKPNSKFFGNHITRQNANVRIIVRLAREYEQICVSEAYVLIHILSIFELCLRACDPNTMPQVLREQAIKVAVDNAMLALAQARNQNGEHVV